MREPSGSAWQRKPGVGSFLVTHARTLVHPFARYREVNHRPSLWLLAVTMAMSIFPTVLVASPLVWWTLPSGADGYAPFASLLSSNRFDFDHVRDAARDFFWVSFNTATLFLPGLLLLAILSPLAPRARLMFTVVMPHASAWLLLPLLTAIAAIPIACMLRYVWPAKQSSAGGEWLILALSLTLLIGVVGFIGSAIGGAMSLRKRAKTQA